MFSYMRPRSNTRGRALLVQLRRHKSSAPGVVESSSLAAQLFVWEKYNPLLQIRSRTESKPPCSSEARSEEACNRREQ
jgi:hypothetical protein